MTVVARNAQPLSAGGPLRVKRGARGGGGGRPHWLSPLYSSRTLLRGAPSGRFSNSFPYTCPERISFNSAVTARGLGGAVRLRWSASRAWIGMKPSE